MENIPLISLVGFNYRFESAERRERYFKWSEAVYIPFRLKNPGMMEYSRYQIIEKNPDYPEGLTLQHFTNQTAYNFRLQNPENVDVTRDMRTGWGTEWLWYGLYRLLKTARRDTALPGKPNAATQIVNAPLLHIETLDLDPKEYDKYARWFNNSGAEIFASLFMETTGMMGWDFCEFTGVTDEKYPDLFKVKTYPKYLLLSYFPSPEDFAGFEKSPSLAAFKRAVKQILPEGVFYKWYVQYQAWETHRREG
jgi:hypothetical protein